MIQHATKLALRHLRKKKVYSIIIIFSLTISLVCTSLLISFIISEYKTDSFHKNKPDVYQLVSNDPFGGNGSIAFIPESVGIFLKDNYPDIKAFCRIQNNDQVSIKSITNHVDEITLISADSSFFDIFSFNLLHGNPQKVLYPSAIAISEKQALLLFGKSDVVGETITLAIGDTIQLATITGILATLPEKSHLKFDAVIHHAMVKDNVRGGATYVHLSPYGNVAEIMNKVNANPERPGLIGDGKMNYAITPLTESYFTSSNKMPYMQTRSKSFMYICMLVCGLIFFMGTFNFANLMILSLHERKKETGIKQTFGITITGMFTSSIAEVAVYTIIALPVSLAITILFLPVVNQLLDASLTTESLYRFEVILLLTLLVLLVGAIISLLIALQNTRVRPISLMRYTAAKTTLHQPFFYLQFILSITLIICSITIVQQMNFIQTESPGFNRNIIQLSAPHAKEFDKLLVLKDKLMQIPGIQNATICSGNPVSGNAIVRYELENGEFYIPYVFTGDENFIQTLGLALIEGTIHEKDAKLVNETFLKHFNIQNPIGEKIPGTQERISGVVKDFTCGSFKNEIPPVIITIDNSLEKALVESEKLLVDFASADVNAVLHAIEVYWKSIFPDDRFSYQIIEHDLSRKYKEEAFFQKLISATSMISILISFFGLFALCWSLVQSKIKEVGIRKVLGATSFSIFSLLTWTFLKRILITFVVAAPAGYYLSYKWLEGFAKRIVLDEWILFYAVGIVVFITLFTLVLQTIKAAQLNPAEELKRND